MTPNSAVSHEIVDQEAETVLSVWREGVVEIAFSVSNQKSATLDVALTANKLLCSVKKYNV